ncbi:hypothetical protein [Yersinia thracica]|uniref:hypothetical protein n=1 Tax=Yersinia thracica TaxID=2890319 RepID=UPI00157C341D|nr:hypothetical protein [Yersinia thracica]
MKIIKYIDTLRQAGVKRAIAGVSLAALLFTYLPAAQAEKITIGKGSGIVWEGLSPHVNESKDTIAAALKSMYGILAVSTSATRCMKPEMLTKIMGIDTVKIADGIGIAPRVNVSATYKIQAGNATETLSGTIGVDGTRASSSGGGEVTGKGYAWCLPPRESNDDNFYQKNEKRTASLDGKWVILADGHQVNHDNIAIPPLYFGSFTLFTADDISQLISPADLTLRVSTLECTVATPTLIDFGSVEYNKKADAELGIITNPMSTTCTQDDDFITSDINVQFRGISGQYKGTPSHLALNEGGGYITGEIKDTNAKNGACGGGGGISFDNSVIKLGEIKDSEPSKTFNNPVTWRLCSGGDDLPDGPVTASTEMMVTFN